MAAIHVEVHGDINYVNIALGLADNPNDKRALADWFCRRAGLTVELSEGTFKFTKSKNPVDRTVSLFEALTKSTGTKDRSTKPVSKLVTDPLLKRSKIRNATDIDILDHPSRLPGSFGSGKRR